MDGHEQSGRALITTLLPAAGLALAVLAGCTAALAGFGHRWGWWHYRTGFTVLKAAAYIGIIAAALSLAGIIVTRPLVLKLGAVLSLAGMLAGLFVAGIPWSWLRTVKQVPAIHDISTDTESPPQFVAVLPFRKDAANPAEYGGSAIAAKQRSASSRRSSTTASTRS